MSTTSTSGRWPVILAGRAIRELRHLGRDLGTLDIVQKKFRELSHGHFSVDNHLVIRGTSENLPIYRARVANDLRIIYQIDLTADPDAQFDHQVIKVFSVSPRARVSYNFWVKVSKYLVRLGTEYRKRCTFRSTTKDTGAVIYFPAVFAHQEYHNAFVNNDYTFEGEIDSNELHETLVLEKFTPITKSLYNSILADMEAVLPMALNPDEKRIVRHPGTSVVVGRSGTGKTTALVYKLRANAQTAAALEDERPIRQLFVTRSRVLTKHIAANYQGLVESSEIANKTRDELAKIREKNNQIQKRELVEFDNEVDLRDDLPDRFSCLKDSHFPLFVSFEKLCALLEGDIASTNEKTTAQLPITFADFKYGHWPKINHALTRNLDPSLVYSEILGVIKGCGEDISREEYISNMSHKRSPLLLDVRDRVYGIFEAYSKRMHMKNQIDAADRTRKILNAHYLSPPPELLKVDYIFVDEVQDHLMLDVHLLQSLCSNPDGGYWCGDTAQTISVGSSFRIKDLKAFIYQNMVLNRTLKPQRKVPAPFTTFELSVNFRSHGGIVRYAASLVELIYTLFPNSIDHMAPETARIHGPPPLLFVGSQHDKEFVQNLVGEKISGNTPFGAHQAIIVRSQSTADSLTTQLQKRCTILTILETKGLEFDDVIIYNFFSESEAPASCWRALLALSTQNENGRICYDKNSVLPSTSPILCSELKQLYVAVTRARYRCWLWDSGEAIDLMKMFWADFGLITVSESLENVGAFPASSNDLQEWTRRGQDFFSSGLYALAKSCFERASQFKEATISDAYQHMSEAKQTRAKADYIKAAGKMEDCANRTDLNDSDNVLWYHAATCFEAAGDVPSASRSYRNGRFYNRAAQISFDNQNFDDCLLTLLRYSNSMDPSTFERIREASRMYYLRASNYKILRKLFDNNQDACIEYARSTGFSAQHKDLLKENNRFDELASVHLAEGFPAEAVGYMLKASKNLSTISRVETIASNYLWLNLSLDSVPNIKIQEQARQLLEILAPFDELLSKKMAVDVKLFKAAIGQHEISLNLASNIDDQDLDSKPRLVLGYHHALHSSFKNFGEMSVALVPGYLKAWHTYAKNITSITEQRSPIQLDAVQKLLGCSVPRKKPRTGRFVHVSSSSFIYVCLKERGYIHVDKKTSRGENLVAIAEVDSIVKHELLQRLNSRLMGLHIEAIDSPWMGLSVAGDAVRTTTEPFAPSFEDQIQMLSLTTTALNSIRMLSTQKLTGSNITTIRSIWVVRLFNLVFPPTGITRDLLGAFQPHGCGTSEQGIYNWVNEHLQSQDPKGRHFRLFLTMLIMGLSLSYELNGLLVPRHNTQSLQSLPRFLVHNGCSTKSECLVTELSCLFQHDNSLRVIGGIRVLQHIIDSELEIDAAVLVHLVERLTREAILAERVAVGSQLLYGISGLIMPLSWARSLTAHLEINEYTLKVGPLRNLILCIGDIIQRLQGGVPGIWAMPCTELWRHSAYSLATRMYRCLALVIVNVPPDHRDLNTALDIIQQDIRCFDMKFECETSSYGNTMGSEVKTLRAVHNQHTCLSALTQTLHHEELVLLENGVQRTCPAKQKMISRIIYFTKLVDLRQKLRGHSAAVQTSLVITAEDQNAAGSRDTSTQSPNEQTGVAIISDAIDSLPEYSAVTRDRAAQRIQLWWRRHCERQDHMGTELNQESACYQRFVSFIPKVVTGTSKRDRLLRNILRGPGLLVIISLESICDQLEELLEAIRQGLQASGISGNNIVDLQKRQKAANEIHQKAETLRKEMSPDSPSGFKANNLSAVKFLLTGKAKTLLGDIKTSKLLDGSKLFEETEILLLRGVEIIRAARAV